MSKCRSEHNLKYFVEGPICKLRDSLYSKENDGSKYVHKVFDFIMRHIEEVDRSHERVRL